MLGLRVEPPQLRVRTEPAVGAVDVAEQRFHRVTCGGEVTVEDQEVDGRAERSPRGALEHRGAAGRHVRALTDVEPTDVDEEEVVDAVELLESEKDEAVVESAVSAPVSSIVAAVSSVVSATVAAVVAAVSSEDPAGVGGCRESREHGARGEAGEGRPDRQLAKSPDGTGAVGGGGPLGGLHGLHPRTASLSRR